MYAFAIEPPHQVDLPASSRYHSDNYAQFMLTVLNDMFDV